MIQHTSNPFETEHISKEVKKIIGNINITKNIFRIYTFNSIMCGYFCIGFTDFVLEGKSLLGDINLSSPNGYEREERSKNTEIFSETKNFFFWMDSKNL